MAPPPPCFRRERDPERCPCIQVPLGVLKKSPGGMSPGKLRQEKANTEGDTGLLDASRVAPEAEGKVVFIGLSDKLVFIPEKNTQIGMSASENGPAYGFPKITPGSRDPDLLRGKLARLRKAVSVLVLLLHPDGICASVRSF